MSEILTFRIFQAGFVFFFIWLAMKHYLNGEYSRANFWVLISLVLVVSK